MSYPFVTLNRKFSLSAMIWSNFFLVSLGLYVFFRAAQRVLNQIDVEKITKIKMKKKTLQTENTVSRCARFKITFNKQNNRNYIKTNNRKVFKQ